MTYPPAPEGRSNLRKRLSKSSEPARAASSALRLKTVTSGPDRSGRAGGLLERGRPARTRSPSAPPGHRKELPLMIRALAMSAIAACALSVSPAAAQAP